MASTTGCSKGRSSLCENPIADGNSPNGLCSPPASFGLKLCVAIVPPTRTAAATEALIEIMVTPVRVSDVLDLEEAIYGPAVLKQKPARRNPGQVPNAPCPNRRSVRSNN